jgi:uncharacterized protein YbgA (DUF1722 family)
MLSRRSRHLRNMSKASLSQKDYEKLGKIVAAVYETGYLDIRKSYKQSFFKGIFQGLGGVIGATILAAVLLWVLSLFSDVPLLGRFVDKVEDTVNTSP